MSHPTKLDVPRRREDEVCEFGEFGVSEYGESESDVFLLMLLPLWTCRVGDRYAGAL